ncbi:MAG TPA: sigma-54 dependent transcriptional regulator [Spirochaetia bacterium]|nr:sigma-54 dependent transcriptional regulator [Spirochaetales bacterium]HRY81166.1 sigma-54 dependent transcriptional regulator [Spirochaetia bacterium]HRZ88241.1 sigma-54 dependent transcriptional regulator [Spirochaetia bacterium]
MNTILVIDDEPAIRAAVRDILQDEKYRVLLAEDGIVGLDILETERADLVILDVRLPRMGGMDVLREIRKRKPELEVLVVSGHGTIDMAVQAVRLGAFDFIEKPLSIDRLLTAVRNGLSMAALRAENRRLRSAVLGEDEIIGDSAAIREVRDLADQAAKSDARVLITGENGTGKELVARRIHGASGRARGPFVAVNCAAIPDTLIESELFGHEKGAFTDAVSRRIGKFEAADGGTLFLDEIADMSLTAQAKVLRAIQDMRFERIGGQESLSADVRVIAATNKDLDAQIAAGRFREDLYFRLAVVLVRVPPLRSRREDIPGLCRFFLSQKSGGNGQARELSAGALRFLSGHDWPGNIRELRNLMERVSVLSDEAEISEATVSRLLGSGERVTAGPCLVPGEYSGLKLLAAKELFERNYLVQKLRESEYTITKAAQAAGIYPSALHAKMKKYGIESGE